MLYVICLAAVLALVLVPSFFIAAELVIIAGVLTPLLSSQSRKGLQNNFPHL